MIARMWRGRADLERADDYCRHVTGKVLPALTTLGGHRGACVLRREWDGKAEFVVITFWDSLDAVRAFAGENVDAAVVEPEARAVLADFDDVVRHYEVVHDSRPR
ncbi:MAG: antibiotic biosynthesis monooxygenase [Gemmatimonadaceae bacterium]